MRISTALEFGVRIDDFVDARQQRLLWRDRHTADYVQIKAHAQLASRRLTELVALFQVEIVRKNIPNGHTAIVQVDQTRLLRETVPAHGRRVVGLMHHPIVAGHTAVQAGVQAMLEQVAQQNAQLLSHHVGDLLVRLDENALLALARVVAVVQVLLFGQLDQMLDGELELGSQVAPVVEYPNRRSLTDSRFSSVTVAAFMRPEDGEHLWKTEGNEKLIVCESRFF